MSDKTHAEHQVEAAELLALWMSKPEVPIYAVLSPGPGPTFCYTGTLYGLIGSLRVSLICDTSSSAVAAINLQLERASRIEVWETPHAYVEHGKRVPGKLIHASWSVPGDLTQRSMFIYHGFNPFEHRSGSFDGDNPLYIG
jgi:hypothetical protein